jgi:hypothetical protein
MYDKILDKIIQRYNTDSEIIYSAIKPSNPSTTVTVKPPDSFDLDSMEFESVFQRLERAAGNQSVGGGATISRYAIWAETIHWLLCVCTEELKRGRNTEKIHGLLTKATNSIKAFCDIQVIFDPFEILEHPEYLNEVLKNKSGIECNKAYFVKLGEEGKWEESCIADSIIRIGWKGQDIRDINSKKWDKIKKELAEEKKNKGEATKDFNALKNICESTNEDIWITFYASKLWWTRVGEEHIYEDNISKYRKSSSPWTSLDTDGNELLINSLPGTLTKTQGFRGTICKVHEKATLLRVLSNKPSKIHNDIKNNLEALYLLTEKAIRELHWKDFETFVDLIFRGSGWKRISMLGETMKYSDIELEDPITKDKYQIQIKSSSSLAEFKEYYKQFSKENFRKLFFVVHSPDSNLQNYTEYPAHVELIKADKLAQMSVELGLVNWLLRKAK